MSTRDVTEGVDAGQDGEAESDGYAEEPDAELGPVVVRDHLRCENGAAATPENEPERSQCFGS